MKKGKIIFSLFSSSVFLLLLSASKPINGQAGGMTHGQPYNIQSAKILTDNSPTSLPQGFEILRIRMNEPAGDVDYFSPLNPETQAPYYSGTISTQGTTSSEIGCGLDRARYFDQEGTNINTDADKISLSYQEVLEQGKTADSSLTVDFWFRYTGGGNQSEQDLVNFQGYEDENYGGWNIWFSPYDNAVHFRVWADSQQVNPVSVTIPGSPGQWVHINAIKDGTSDPDTIGICAAVNGNIWNCSNAVAFTDTIKYIPDTALEIGAWENGNATLDDYWHGYIDEVFLTTSGGIAEIDNTQDSAITPGCLSPTTPTPTPLPSLTLTPTRTISPTPTATPYCIVKNDSCGNYFITAADPFTMENNNNQYTYHIVEVRQPHAQFAGVFIYSSATRSYLANLAIDAPLTTHVILGGGSNFQPLGPNWYCVAKAGEEITGKACTAASTILNHIPATSYQHIPWNETGWPGEIVNIGLGIEALCSRPGGCQPGQFDGVQGDFQVYFIWKKLSCECPYYWLNDWCTSTYENVFGTTYNLAKLIDFIYDNYNLFFTVDAMSPVEDIFHENGLEAIELLRMHPEIVGEVYELAEVWEPKLRGWREGLGDSVIISSEEANQMDNFISELIDASPDGLKQKIENLKARFNIPSMAGLTMNQAWERIQHLDDPTPTATLTVTPTTTPTETPPPPSPTPTDSPTATPTDTPTDTPTLSPTSTAGPVVVSVFHPGGAPETGLTVYAMDGSTYTGISGVTDSEGRVTLSLPDGSYRFRVDKQGQQFWSGSANHCTVPGCAAATVTTKDPVLVTVQDTDGNPDADLNVLAYVGDTFAGVSGVSDAQGRVTLWLGEGNYRFRAAKNGTVFWSGTENHCMVPGCEVATITTTVPVTVTVMNLNGNPEPDLYVRAMIGSIETSYIARTNAQGTATLTLPPGSYRFRVWKNERYFWSSETSQCTVPECTTSMISIDYTIVVTVQDTDGNTQIDMIVHAYDGNTFAGFAAHTDSQGRAFLSIPAGSYRFRFSKDGMVYWSGPDNHCTVPECTAASITVTEPVTVTVGNLDGSPEPGLYVRAMNGTTETVYVAKTDAQGLATLALPLGSYRFRVYKNERFFWSGETNHCTVPDCIEAAIAIDYTVVVAVQDTGGNPEVGMIVHAYHGTTFAGFAAHTDSQGRAFLSVPAGSYRFRFSKDGTVYWSGADDHCIVPGCIEASITTGGGIGYRLDTPSVTEWWAAPMANPAILWRRFQLI